MSDERFIRQDTPGNGYVVEMLMLKTVCCIIEKKKLGHVRSQNID